MTLSHMSSTKEI